jgi:hypothetical protein
MIVVKAVHVLTCTAKPLEVGAGEINNPILHPTALTELKLIHTSCGVAE